MYKQERVQFIHDRLRELYPNPQPPLHHRDPFTLLVGVVLSAQSTDARVNLITPALFERADTAAEMAEVPVKEIQDLIQSCGLAPTKAKAISQFSRILAEQYDGQPPDNFEELETLPGVGHKTAGVVLCQAYGKDAFPVDTHIHRLAQRWKLTNGKNVVQTEKDLMRLFPQESWSKLHLQFIFYGREHCTAHGCKGLTCEICRTCFPDRKRPVKVKKP